MADCSLEFILRHSDDAVLPPLSSIPAAHQFVRVHWRDAFDAEQQQLREELCSVKAQLDAIDDDVYTTSRNHLFPLAVSGEQQYFSNRAGYKLMEAMESTGVWGHLKRCLRGSSTRFQKLAFADICGGPGAFSQALFLMARRERIKMVHGFGITLGGVDGLDWYPQLVKSAHFTPSYGLDGRGDIFQLSNINCFASITAGAPLLLAVADGGFNVDFSVANYQETISARILYGQWLAALKVLCKGGCFILKLFDTFAPSSRLLLYLSTFFFGRVHISKPRHSRVVNSERYLVCLNFVGELPGRWMDYLDAYYQDGFIDNDVIPEHPFAANCLADEVFMTDLREMNATLASNQMIGLHMIVRAAKTADAPPGSQ